MLALVAGRGALPDLVAAALPGCVVCALDGQRPDHLVPEIWFRLETLGSLLKTLQDRGVTEVCFCGAIDRPGFDPAALDAATLPLVPLLQEALGQGDDGALRAVIGLFERHGLQVRGAHELTPDVLMPEGVPTHRRPPSGCTGDVDAASKVLAAMAAADEGQACLIRDGVELAREDARGTDAMLADVGSGPLPPETLFDAGSADVTEAGQSWIAAARAAFANAPAAKALLFKAPKPGQERRADLPTIGPQTGIAAIRAGLDGIVIEADGVIVLDAARLVALLDAAGMFLWVRAP